MFRSLLKLATKKTIKLVQEPWITATNNSSSFIITGAGPVRHFRALSTSSAMKKEDKLKVKLLTPKGPMQQTTIGQFFKKGASHAAAGPAAGSSSSSSPSPSKAKKDVEAESPVKKVDEEDEEDRKLEKKKTENGKDKKSPVKESEPEPVAAKNGGRKRRSKSTSSEEVSEEEEEVKPKSKSSKKVKPEAKKQRRRIVVQDSSSEDEVANKESESEEELPVKASAKSKQKSPEKEESSCKKKVSPKAKKSPETKKENGNSGKKKQSPTPEKEAKRSRKSSGGGDEEENVDEEKKKNGTSAKKRSPSPTPEKETKKSKKGSGGGDADETEEANGKEKPKGEKPAVKESRASIPPPKGWNPDYNPGKNKYHPIDDASWTRDQRVPYLALAKTLEAIEATSSRLKNIEILANYFRSVIILSPNDLLMSVYLCLNKLAPAYEGVELGVAETNVMKAIAQATGRAMDKVKADAAAAGDLGIVAENSRSTQKTLFQPPPLTVHAVFQKLKEVASMSGSASHQKKISMITSLLVACKYSEARYLTRSLLGKLRIGLAEQSLLQAIAQACFLTPPDQDRSEWPPKYVDRGRKLSAESVKAQCEAEAYKIKSAFCECPNYDILVKALLEVGTDGIDEECKLTPGIPPRPMLAQPTKGVADVLERFDGINFTCEYKYDGERAQLHLLEDGSIRIYSRNQENNTSKYPDILSRFSKCIKGDVKSCILDAEAVAWDIEKECILPFQVLSTRKRKDADEAEIKVQVCVFAFDLIYLNGKSLIKEPLIKRRELLRENFQAIPAEFVFATSIDTDSMDKVQEFLEESMKGNCEGLMVKTLDEKATYELAKRSQKWLKLKKDYLDSGGDSLDLVVIGGYLGKGKRTGNYGGFLLACYDPDQEAYQTICKLGTGFSDEQLLQHTEALKPHVIPHAKSYYRYNDSLKPDHWFDAVQVWEVKCADLSISPVHKAAEGMADPQKGISLRFPRFMRIRDDKNIEDATSASQVVDMYRNQEVVKNSTDKKKGVDDDDDFY